MENEGGRLRGQKHTSTATSDMQFFEREQVRVASRVDSEGQAARGGEERFARL